MTSSWTVRVLAGLVAVSLAVLGVSLISGGGDDEGADDAADTVALTGGNGGGKAGGGGDGDSAKKGKDGSSPEVEEEIERLQEERAKANEMSDDEKDAQGRAQRFYDILSQEKGDENSTKFDSAGFCDLMSEEAREQTIEYAKRSSGIDQEWKCENSVELLVIRSKRTGGFKQARKARIVAVNAEGDLATATVRFGKGPLTSIPLIKEDGEWKLGSSAGAEQQTEEN